MAFEHKPALAALLVALFELGSDVRRVTAMKVSGEDREARRTHQLYCGNGGSMAFGRAALVAFCICSGLGSASAPAAEPANAARLTPKMKRAMTGLSRESRIPDLLFEPYPEAFRQILLDPSAIPAFVEVTRTGQPAGKLWALAGLRIKGSEEFEPAARRVRRATAATVEVMIGDDVAIQIPLPEAVDLLTEGGMDAVRRRRWTR